MYVFLKFNELEKVISNVTVDDECAPVVENEAIICDQYSVSIEAIPWFKSMAIEAVYIDCGSRDARWTPKKVVDQVATTIPIQPSEYLRRKLKESPSASAKPKQERVVPFMPENARPLFTIQQGVVDFDPNIDEMFERVEKILVQIRSNGFKDVELRREIAQLLHCYIFPSIVFLESDVPVLKGCWRRIGIRIQSVEKEIVAKEKSITLAEDSLSKQKLRIINTEEMTNESYIRTCDRTFLDAFYFYVTKDIQDMNLTLERVQRKLNELRKQEQPADSPCIELEGLVKERDSTHQHLQILMSVRESIRNVLYRPHVPQPKQKRKSKKGKENKESENCLHKIFVEVHETLKIARNDLKKLIYTKLRFTSMREAAESAIRLAQLNTGECQGDMSEFSMNVGNEDQRISNWRTIQENVAVMLENVELEVFCLHKEGCQLIKDLVRSMLSDELLSVTSIPSKDRSSRVKSPEIMHPEEEFVLITYPPPLPETGDNIVPSIGNANRLVEEIRKQVLRHTWSMAKVIVQAIGLDPESTRHINRAWMCYLPYFCKEALEDVESLYNHVYGSKAYSLHGIVSTLALNDIMDDAFFKDVFENRLKETTHTCRESGCATADISYSRSAESVSALSLDLQRCSISDLYEFANRDCQKLETQMCDLDLDPVRHVSASFIICERSLNGSNSLSVDATNSISQSDNNAQLPHSMPSSGSDSGASVQWDDLFAEDVVEEVVVPTTPKLNAAIVSSQTVASVLSVFESIVQPYQKMVQEVLDCTDLMEKMQAVWRSVTFLNRKTEEHCKSGGMDSLLPMSIFATVSLRREVFIRYYVQLQMLIDFKPDYFLHSMYDFSLTNAITPYIFLFDRKVVNSLKNNSSA